MSKIITFHTLMFSLLFTITGCKNYSLSINENEVYSPAKIFTQFSLKDPELQHCVDAIIKEKKLTRAEQVTSIVCGPNGISSLEGLEIFTELQQLGIQNNNVSSITTLTKLKKITQLDLGNNPVTNIAALYELKNLEYLNLKGAKSVDCNQVTTLKQRSPALQIYAPKHCSSN